MSPAPGLVAPKPTRMPSTLSTIFMSGYDDHGGPSPSASVFRAFARNLEAMSDGSMVGPGTTVPSRTSLARLRCVRKAGSY